MCTSRSFHNNMVIFSSPFSFALFYPPFLSLSPSLAPFLILPCSFSSFFLFLSPFSFFFISFTPFFPLFCSFSCPLFSPFFFLLLPFLFLSLLSKPIIPLSSHFKLLTFDCKMLRWNSQGSLEFLIIFIPFSCPLVVSPGDNDDVISLLPLNTLSLIPNMVKIGQASFLHFLCPDVLH